MIAVYCDGTWNDPSDAHTTNIWRMHRATPGSIYVPGIGSEAGEGWKSWGWVRAFRGATGRGADEQRDLAYKALSDQWAPGAPIFLFGFSRGAAVARMLAVKIEREGINGHFTGIRFLGCFDTVASFGIPGNSIDLFKDFHVAASVENAYHAVALDETRDTFKPSLMNQRPGITEVWFRGNHSDVGGGHAARGLANIAMDWMAQAARKHGLEIGAPDRGDDTRVVHYSVPGIDSPTCSPRKLGVLVANELVPGPFKLHSSVRNTKEDWPRAWPLSA